jgi:hypothetical protein
MDNPLSRPMVPNRPVQLDVAGGRAFVRDRSVQRPQGQAKERDEEAIQHRVAQEWPRIKGGPRELGLARLRRIGRLADPIGAAHLVPAWAHAGLASPGAEAGPRQGAGLSCW